MTRLTKFVPGFAPRNAKGPIIARSTKERGSNLLEYALVFLVLMAMLLGLVEFCRALYAYHFVANVAREATRWAAVNGATCGAPPAGDNSCVAGYEMNTGPASAANVQSYVTNHAPMGIDSSRLTAAVSWPVKPSSPTPCSTTATQNSPGCTVAVTVGYQFNFIFPFIYQGAAATACGGGTSAMCLSSTSEMVIAH